MPRLPYFWNRFLLTGLFLATSFSPVSGFAFDQSTGDATDIPLGCLAPRASDLVMVDFSGPQAIKQLAAPKNLAFHQRNDSVEITGPILGRSQSLILTPGGPLWDLSNYLYVAADVHNGSPYPVTIICRVEDPDYAGWHHFSTSVTRVAAGETTTALVFLKRKNPPAESLCSLFPGMDALPDGYMPHWSGLDPSRISKVVFELESPGSTLDLNLRNVRATGILDAAPLTAPGYFPFIDRFGQFLHADWPTKIHSPKDFSTQRMTEAAVLQAQPRPTSWDKYGGYKDGPQLVATGNFRAEKYHGKWWLVDPDGRLFWSHGVTGVGFSSPTPVSGRRKFFTDLPPLGQGDPKYANWYLVNLYQKYGADAETQVASLTHERLASWGLNTMASWSDEKITSLDRTPYTIILNIGGQKLAPGLKLSDPFDPEFPSMARRAFETERLATGKDPWCIGYFIGNELEWRNGPDLVNEVLTARAKQPGKQALLKLLQQRHSTIANLNQNWRTAYHSWEELLDSTNQVDPKLAIKDFTAFNQELADRYYQICENEFQRTIPNKLNLGSRFNTGNPIAIRAAARYCDVVSFNKYETSIRNLTLPDGLDRPIIIGEFDFPAWDRSYTANADCGRLCEARRADSYWYYLTGALENPLVVGTHWFQYLDQPLTGRADRENFPIGFVDVTDTPYYDLTKVTRDLGENLYALRLGSLPTSNVK